jgi:hypothetical protein
VQPIHQREHHHLENQSSEEVRQQEVHLHKEQQLEEPVQATLVKYIHHAEEEVVQYSEWQDTILLSDYQSFEEKQQKTLRSICSFVQRYGKQSRSLMITPNSRS